MRTTRFLPYTKGQLTRKEGRKNIILRKNFLMIFEFVLKRLSLDTFIEIMNEKSKHWTDYPTYKKLFELFQPLFYIFAKFQLVPMSFYIKYYDKNDYY